MVDPSSAELRALEHAGACGGQFIDECRVTDMAAWNERQWHGFIRAICAGYVDSLLAQQVEANEAATKVKT